MANPVHPYTKALISAVPQYKRTDAPIELKGEIPSPINPPPGCNFHTRCPIAAEGCSQATPQLLKKHAPQLVACHRI